MFEGRSLSMTQKDIHTKVVYNCSRKNGILSKAQIVHHRFKMLIELDMPNVPPSSLIQTEILMWYFGLCSTIAIDNPVAGCCATRPPPFCVGIFCRRPTTDESTHLASTCNLRDTQYETNPRVHSRCGRRSLDRTDVLSTPSTAIQGSRLPRRKSSNPSECHVSWHAQHSGVE